MAQWDVIEDELKSYVEEFNRLYKCVNKKNLPKQDKVQEHIYNIIVQYNDIVNLYKVNVAKLTTVHVKQIENSFYLIRDKVVSLFNHLKVKVFVPLSITVIDQTVQDPDFLEKTISDDTNMPQDSELFLRLCAQTINTKYLGDPLKLQSFLNSVALLEKMVKPENQELLTTFVISKLEEKGLEEIKNPNTTDLQEVKNNLKNIKPDNSDIIEGRFLALRQDKLTLQDFAKQAEDLADALKRTYMIEGISPDKANNMKIKKNN